MGLHKDQTESQSTQSNWGDGQNGFQVSEMQRDYGKQRLETVTDYSCIIVSKEK